MNNCPKKIAVYPGSFDPITNGHLDLIHRSLRIFDQLVIIVANNTLKGHRPFFAINERVDLIRKMIDNNSKVSVLALENQIIVQYAKKIGAQALIRGLRVISDFEFEFTMAAMNRSLEQSIETVFLTPTEQYSFISSSLIKEVIQAGGDISKFVPKQVQSALQQKIKAQKNQLKVKNNT